MPKLYIALATYNGEKYLPQMLDSLLLQTRPADKVIAVDDGSKDTTVAILESYKNRLPLDIHPQKENKGHRAAFGLCLEFVQKEAAPEDFIALADQDDVWLPEKLEILSEKIGNADLVFGDAEVIGKDGEKIADSWRARAKLGAQQTDLERIAGTNNVTGCLSLFPASLLAQILPIPTGIDVHDSWIALIAARHRGIRTVPDKVILYRLHEGNAVGLGKTDSFSCTLKKQEAWFLALTGNKERLKLTEDESLFIRHYLKFIKARESSPVIPLFFPWLCRQRRILFPAPIASTDRWKKIFFSMIGIPFAKLFFGKS